MTCYPITQLDQACHMSSSDPKLSYFWLVQLSALISELFYGIDFLLIVHAYCIDMLHSIDFDILHSIDFDMSTALILISCTELILICCTPLILICCSALILICCTSLFFDWFKGRTLPRKSALPMWCCLRESLCFTSKKSERCLTWNFLWTQTLTQGSQEEVFTCIQLELSNT